MKPVNVLGGGVSDFYPVNRLLVREDVSEVSTFSTPPTGIGYLGARLQIGGPHDHLTFPLLVVHRHSWSRRWVHGLDMGGRFIIRFTIRSPSDFREFCGSPELCPDSITGLLL